MFDCPRKLRPSRCVWSFVGGIRKRAGAKKEIAEWGFLPNRAVCACPYYSCGVHSDSEGFKRRATGKITLDAAKSVTRVRLERGDWQAEIEDPTLVKVEVAIEDFMGDVRDKGAEDSTLDKYTTLMDQLQAFSDDKGITYIQHFGQDEMKQFRRDSIHPAYLCAGSWALFTSMKNR